MTATGGQPDLSAFQQEVARMFFALPASEGFLLAGGAALVAQHLTTRSTEDLDFFTAPEQGRVPAARDGLEAEARRRGWTTERIHDSETFCRMVVRSADDVVLVDLAVNAPPDLPAGFDGKVLADMIGTLDRFVDDELPVPNGSSPAELRAFYAAWRSELAA
jgi:hypothetical protein